MFYQKKFSCNNDPGVNRCWQISHLKRINLIYVREVADKSFILLWDLILCILTMVDDKATTAYLLDW